MPRIAINSAMSDSMTALAREKEIDLRARTESIAQDINEILTRVQADTTEMAAYASFLYNNPNLQPKQN